MTNYDKLKAELMQDPEFHEAYDVARLQRVFEDYLESLKAKILADASKEVLIAEVSSMQAAVSQGKFLVVN